MERGARSHVKRTMREEVWRGGRGGSGGVGLELGGMSK